MKEANLSVTVKRACQTTASFDAQQQWINRLENLDICRKDQVWVDDITYVHLKKRFVHVAVLMDVFTRIISGWKLSQHLTESLTLRTLEQALRRSVPENHHSDQGVQYLSNAYISVLGCHGIGISLAHRGCPWKNDLSEHSRRKRFTSMTIII